MTVILTCGHKCDVRPFGIPIALKSHDREGNLGVDLSQYCHPCYVEMVSQHPDQVLFDSVEIEQYLSGEEG